MSPRVADPAVRAALVENAARITAEEGREALTLRRLAAEVGTSTMAVYTHFGGMNELRHAVRQEGFARLADHLAAVEATADPVADLLASGWAYYTNAITNPHLYRAMFMEVREEGAPPVGLETFDLLIDGIQRCIDEGRFGPAEARPRATQLWASVHGCVALELAGMLSREEAVDSLLAMARNHCVGYGDSPEAVDRSMAQANQRILRA